MTKIIVSVGLAVCLLVTYQLFGIAQPEIATSLALEQFENPSVQTDTAMRSYNNTQIFWYMCAGWVALNLFMFYPNIKETIKDA